MIPIPMEDDFFTESPEGTTTYEDNNYNGGGGLDDTTMSSADNYQDPEYGFFGMTPAQDLDYNPGDESAMNIAPSVMRGSTTTKPQQMKTTPRKKSRRKLRTTTTRKPRSPRYYYSFLLPRRDRPFNWFTSFNSRFGRSNWLMKG